MMMTLFKLLHTLAKTLCCTRGWMQSALGNLPILRGEWTVSAKPGPKSVYDFLGLIYCFTVLWCVWFAPSPTWYSYTLMARFSLLVLKVPLNTIQLTNSTSRTYYAPLPLGGGIKRRCCLTSVCLSCTSALSQEQRGLRRLKLAQR